MENIQLHQKAHHDVATQPHKFQEGEEVYLRNFGRGESWLPGWIVKHTSSVSFLIRGLDGQAFRRHQDHFLNEVMGHLQQNSQLLNCQLMIQLWRLSQRSHPHLRGRHRWSRIVCMIPAHKHCTQPCRQVTVYKHRIPLCHRVSAFQDRAQVYHQLSIIHREIGQPLTVTILD